MAYLTGIQFKSIGGAIEHCVSDDYGTTIGWISEVFTDVFYVQHVDNTNKITTRFRRMSDAIKAFN